MGITQRKGGVTPDRTRGGYEYKSPNLLSLASTPQISSSPRKQRRKEDPIKPTASTITATTATMNKIAKAVLIIPILLLTLNATTIGFYSRFTPRTWQIRGSQYNVHIDVKRNAGSVDYSMGPHQVTVLTSAECDAPPIFMRIIGDALVDVPLVEEGSKMWVGSFELPMDGSYRLQSNWVGCDHSGGMREIQYHNFRASGMSLVSTTSTSAVTNADALVSTTSTSAVTNADADNTKTTSTDSDKDAKEDNALFAKGAWITTETVTTATLEIIPTNKFVWVNREKVIQHQEMSPLKGPDKSMVYQESVVTDRHGFSSFGKLSNYEIVCWIGSTSANNAWGAFLALRPQLFETQRPFKFHYYPATTFVTPDTKWEESHLQQHNPYGAFRKCKHIFISLEEPDPSLETQGPLTQREYRDQVKTFIKHLLNAFNEEYTFPALIWMMTVNESAISPQNCHSPYLQKTTNHPCNDALKDLFNESPFPDRVRLLDNTDLSAPMWGHGGDDIWTAIALRIFVLVGKQVEIWRDAGISGGINGQTQNGVTKPNFELVRYDWSQKLDGNGASTAQI